MDRLGCSQFFLIFIAILAFSSVTAHSSSTSARPTPRATTPSQPQPSTSESQKPNSRPPTTNHLIASHTTHGKKNNSCNLAVDTVKKNPDKPGHYLKCERKTWRPESGNSSRPTNSSSQLVIVTAEWTPYECSKKTLEECIEEFMLEKNITKGLFNSPGDYDYDSLNSVNQLASECRVTSPPSPGAICCASQSARLEVDNTDSQYYLQCVPTQGTQSQFGTWVRMQCPSGMVFNFAAQLCLNAYGSPLGSQGQGANATAGAAVLPLCPDGERSNILCNNLYCPPKYFCHHGVCCAAGQEVKAPGMNAGVAAATNQFKCPDGRLPDSPCQTDNECARGFICTSGYCCKSKHVTNLRFQSPCPGYVSPAMRVTSCGTSNQCPTGYFCPYSAGICCPQPSPQTQQISISVCAGAVTPSNPCSTTTQCPPTYYCNVGVCCPQQTTSSPCQNGLIPVGPCVNSQCGTGFTCNTATNMCCPSLATCANGAQAIGPCVNGVCGTGYTCNTTTSLCCPTTCANGQTAVGNCVGGVCGPGFTCETASNLCCPTIATTTIRPITTSPCTSGYSTGFCVSGLCGVGYYCVNFICCPVSGGTATVAPAGCPDGSPAVGVCINGQCGPSFTCTSNNLCCPATTASTAVCPDMTQPAGACIGGLCGTGFTCILGSNICCPGTAGATTRCLDGSTPAGPCVNNLCGVGFTCTTGNLCCPQASTAATAVCPNGQPSAGPCVSGLCAAPYSCTPENECCLASSTAGTCPNGGRSEPCNADGVSCPTIGFTCIDGFTCCNLGGGSAPIAGDCNAVANALGPCVPNEAGVGLCPSLYQCIGGCCVPTTGRVRGEPDPSSSAEFDLDLPAPRRPYIPRPDISDLWPNTGRASMLGHSYGDILGSGPRSAQGIAPGSPCSGRSSWECSGAKQGLAACVSKTCTCLPPAKSTGPTCVMPPRQSISRPAIGRPYHAHSHIFPGVFSDAVPSGNETWNETIPVPSASSSPNHNTATLPTVSLKTLSRTVGCGKTADCDSKLHEQCINGTCIAPKAPGDKCTSKTECVAYCPNTDCVITGRGARICMCPDKTYRYGRKCFSKCPKGTRLVMERRECEDVTYSNMLRDSVISFDNDVKVTSLC